MKEAKKILQQLPKLDACRYDGDIAATDILIDFAAACELAQLTDEQKEALALLYIDGYTQEGAAALVGVERSTMTKRALNGTAALEEVYAYWRYHDEAEAKGLLN